MSEPKLSLSASQIESFDEDTPFGCERKWFYKSVLKIEEPEGQTKSQSAGTILHKEIQEYLVNGALPRRTSLMFWSGFDFIDSLKGGGTVVEHYFKKQLGEWELRGYVDVALPYGILDWKTTSSIKKYAKKKRALEHNTQMLVYAWALDEHLTDPLYLTHVYFEPPKLPQQAVELVQKLQSLVLEDKKLPDGAEEFLQEIINNLLQPPTVVETQISKKERDVNFRRVETLIASMYEVSKAGSPDEVKPDRRKCRMCPYRNICPQDN